MSKHEAKSAGQILIEKLEGWIGGYLHTVDRDLPLVLAMWAIGSWVFDRFYAWPYLVVTAATKGAGKTRVLELLKLVTRNPFLGVSPSPPFVLREIKRLGGHFTLLWDEAEASAASDAKSFFSEVMNSGYRRGQEIGRAKGPEDTVRYPSYCPKAFSLIGDPTGTIKDRSIIAEMERGNAEREYYPEVAEGEGFALLHAIKTVLGEGDGAVQAAPPSWLDARDREVWGAMFGLAGWLKLDSATMRRLERFAADNIAAKTAPRRRAATSEGDEAKAVDDAYAQRALNDLRSIMREGEASVWSAVAVERMKEIATGPWRTFKGKGLDPDALAGLVSRFGVQPRDCRMAKGRKDASGATNPVRKGYSAKDVKASTEGGAR